MRNMSAQPPPRAPTFPSLDPDPVQLIDEEEPVEDLSVLPTPPTTHISPQHYNHPSSYTDRTAVDALSDPNLAAVDPPSLPPTSTSSAFDSVRTPTRSDPYLSHQTPSHQYQYNNRVSPPTTSLPSDDLYSTPVAEYSTPQVSMNPNAPGPMDRDLRYASGQPTHVPARDDTFNSIRSSSVNPGVDSTSSNSASVTSSTSAFGSSQIAPSATQARSRLRALLTWKDPRITGAAFALCLLFFYLTLFKQYSILSVIGGLLGTYLTVGLIVVHSNPLLGHPFDRFIKRPPSFAPLLTTASAHRWADTIVEEGNEFANDARHLLYCDDTSLTITWICISFVIYVIGKFCSMLPVFFMFTLALFTVPKFYEMNKDQVDSAITSASNAAARNFHTGRKVAGERAWQFKEAAAERSAPFLDKSPAVKNIANRVGFTPTKKQM